MVNVQKALSPKRGRMRRTDKTKAVAYIRVSTGKQDLSPAAQRESIEAYAAANGLEILAWHSETVSTRTPLSQRIGLFTAIDDCTERRAGVFIVCKRDRLNRDKTETELMSRAMQNDGIELIGADQEEANGDTITAKLLRGMLDAIAEYERGMIAARTKAALAVRKRKGLKGPGSIPYGKRLADDRQTLEDDPQEAAVLNRIRRERKAGSSLQAIVDSLNADGVPARGKRWHRTTVDRILNATVDPEPSPDID